jgi:predicted ATP-binding protein involved in virulence
MRVTEIKVEGLFDMFDHTIVLNQAHRLTIVYGENGVGKTTLMKLVKDFFSDKGQYIFEYSPFRKLTIHFDNNEVIEFAKTESNNKFLIFLETKNDKQEINYNDVKFNNIRKLINVYFIETERLIKISRASGIAAIINSEPKITIENSVTLFSQSLAKTIKEKTTLYRKISDDLKNSLNQRILDKKVKTDISIAELKRIATDVEDKKQKYKAVGLLGDTNGNIKIPDDINDLEKAILAVNIQDVQKQLEIYEEDNFYERLRLFIEILNERRFSYKKISISEERGFIFTNTNGKDLNAEDLSSGEQHELVLLYQLLFTIPENALIMIDEPEMSLHITWQKAFVNDMEEIIKLRNFDILLATHSPSIINGNWDITQSLEGNEQQ